MKNFIQFLPNALIVGLLAGLMQFIDIKSGAAFLAWSGFAAWACYFVNGCTVKGGIKVIGTWIAGVIAAIAIIELGTWLTSSTGDASVGFPLAVALIAFVVILFEKVPALDFIPGWFVGAACFFALTNQLGNYQEAIKPILIAAVVGQVFGFLTVLLRTRYAAMIADPEKEVPTVSNEL